MATRFDSFLNSPNSKNLPPKRKVLQDYQDIRAKLTEIKKKHGVIDDSPSILDDLMHTVSKDFLDQISKRIIILFLLYFIVS